MSQSQRAMYPEVQVISILCKPNQTNEWGKEV